VFHARRGWERPIVAGLLLALALGLPPCLSSTSHPVSSLSARPSTWVSPATASPTLELDPTTWWMVAGNTTRLAATWADVPAGCIDAPVWYGWSVVSGWEEGVVSPFDGSTANFTAAAVASGTAEIEVRAASVVTCGGTELAINRSTTANVTVVVPPTISGLTAVRDPISAEGITHLTGTLFGGDPPYRLWVDWGDGNRSRVNLTTAGPFAIPHRFGAGNFTPDLIVEDSAGLFTNASVEEPVYASSGFGVGIETSEPVAEVGRPVEFTGAMVDPPASFSYLESCSDSLLGPAAPTPADDPANLTFSCTFAAAGVAQVDLKVIPIGDDLPVSEAEMALPVEGPLGEEVGMNTTAAEVGRPAVASVDLAGGVPPFTIQWQVSGNASETRAEVNEDGSVFLPVWPSQAGTFGLSVSATDSTGATVENGSVRFSVDPALRASVSVAGAPDPNGASVSASGAVSQGTAPFVWFVAAGLRPANGTPDNGTLPAVGEFSWSGVLPFEGNSSVTVGVVDSDGAVWWTSVAVDLIPALAASVSLESVPGNQSAELWLNLTVENGLAPYSVWSNFSDAVSENETLGSAGLSSIEVFVNRSGLLTADVTVVDRLGVRAFTNASVIVSFLPPPSSPPPAPPPTPPIPPLDAHDVGNEETLWTEAAAATLALVLLAALVAYLWRRRQQLRRSKGPGPDPVTVLHRIIEPADGVDRATVELMAEENGIPLSTVRATLDRLIAEGTVRSETGTDGEEVMAWSVLDRP